MIGASSGHVELSLAPEEFGLTDAEQSVCSDVSGGGGLALPLALSGRSTALLEERHSQEGRPRSMALISRCQGGFIGLINSHCFYVSSV